MSNSLLRKYLIVDSNKYANPSDFTVNLTAFQTKDFYHFRVLDLTVPYTYYDVFGQYLTLNYTVRDTHIPQDNTTTLTISAGNYNITSLKAELQNKLNANNQFGEHYTVDISTINGKMSISTNNARYQISITGGDLRTIIGWKNTVSSFSQVSTSPYVINPYPIDMLYLESSLNSVSIYSASEDRTTRTIATMVPNLQPFDVLYRNYENPLVLSFPDESLNSISFKLVDRLGNIIDLNGQGIVFTIEFF